MAATNPAMPTAPYKNKMSIQAYYMTLPLMTYIQLHTRGVYVLDGFIFCATSRQRGSIFIP